MLISSTGRRKTALILGVVGLMLALAVAVSPALAQTILLDRFRAEPQSVIVEDATGRYRGKLDVDLKGLADGSVSGPATLLVGETTYEFDFAEVTEIRLGADGRPEGIRLKGTGTMTQDEVVTQLLNLQARVEREGDDDIGDPTLEIVDDAVLDMLIIGEVVDITPMYKTGGESN